MVFDAASFSFINFMSTHETCWFDSSVEVNPDLLPAVYVGGAGAVAQPGAGGGGL
jgi:hypothetical protein